MPKFNLHEEIFGLTHFYFRFILYYCFYCFLISRLLGQKRQTGFNMKWNIGRWNSQNSKSQKNSDHYKLDAKIQILTNKKNNPKPNR